MDNDEFRRGLYEILGLQEAANPDILTKVRELGAFVQAIQDLFGGAKAPLATVQANVQAQGALMGKIRELLKISDSADEKEVIAKLYSLTQPEGSVSREEFHSLQEKLADTEAETLVAKAEKLGKITPAMREWAKKYAKDCPGEFEKFMMAQPVIVPLNWSKNEKLGNAKGEITEQQYILARQMGLDATRVYGKQASE